MLLGLHKNDKSFCFLTVEESKDQDTALSGKMLNNPIPNVKN